MKIKDLLTDETKWIQHTSARTANGLSVVSNDLAASSWCLWGAISRCYPAYPEKGIICDRVYERVGGNLPEWNDAPKRTFAEVRELVVSLDI